MRAAPSAEALSTLRHRAEETLAADQVARTPLGYDMVVKLKPDESLLERDSLRLVVETGGASLEGAA